MLCLLWSRGGRKKSKPKALGVKGTEAAVEGNGEKFGVVKGGRSKVILGHRRARGFKDVEGYPGLKKNEFCYKVGRPPKYFYEMDDALGELK